MKNAINKYSVLVFCILFTNLLYSSNEDRIVFLSNRDTGKQDIFLLELKGMSLENLTRSITEITLQANSAPKINHKRNSILFLSIEPLAIYELFIQTKIVHKVVEVKNNTCTFLIDPTESSLVYTEKVNSVIQLFSIELNEKIPRNISNNNNNNYEHALSPDGKKIAFVCDAQNSNSIYTMNYDGSGKKLLTNNFGEDRYPSFSFNSASIVFCSSRSTTKETDLDIYSIDTTGQNFQLLYQNKTFNEHPFFIENNTIVFNSNIRGQANKDIMRLNISNGEIEMLTKTLGNISSNVSINRNNELLVFENSSPMNSEIYLYNLKTKELINLTSNRNRDIAPSF